MHDTQTDNAKPEQQKSSILWWGRSGLDYSRNRIMRENLHQLGWTINDFWPRVSRFGHLEALWRVRDQPSLVWVPCFRQRDLASACRWARARGIPVIFDALISAYDKQVHERKRLPEESRKANRLLSWEQKQLSKTTHIMVDTTAHAQYFHETLLVPADRITVVPVGAEENLFSPSTAKRHSGPLQVLFYGSFIPLQGPEIVIEAARITQHQEIEWQLLGNGPLQGRCQSAAADLENVAFEPWLAYESLRERIQKADVLLGVFGSTQKTQRVIPNKVFQAMACGKPVVTSRSSAYPQTLLLQENSGVTWVPAANPEALAKAIQNIAANRQHLEQLGKNAHESYRQHFSETTIRAQLAAALAAAIDSQSNT